MPPAPGSHLGPYEIVALIGAGGMGEVYRARDSKLNRDVAIKVLPAAVASDSDRLSRFHREAQFLAALNHPNIAHIHGLEDSTGVPALVMELVEGPTLAQMLAGPSGRRPVDVPQALEIGRQIARALASAHAAHVVHRDLKPANIKVRPDGTVKILDFGLARAMASGGGGSGGDLSNAPTLTSPAHVDVRSGGVDQSPVAMTQAGVILGTAAYMSPEQARGEPVDARADVWAFGCVLYEMLTALGPFAGVTASESLAKVLERDPDWSALPTHTPERVRQLLRRCLKKNASERLSDIAGAEADIESALAPRARLRTVAASTIAAAAVAVIVGAILWLRPQPSPTGNRADWVQLTKFPDSVTQPALSPDGNMLAFVRGPGTFYTPGQVYVKMLPDGEPKQLTHDALRKMSPVFAPDGTRLAYTTVDDAQFKWDTWLVPVLGGEPRMWLPNASGLTWIAKGRLLFSEIKTGNHMAIVTAAESRTEARDVYVPARANGMAHRSYLSPDGHWALVVEMDGPWLPCRLAPVDRRSPDRQVGPTGAPCTAAAWSPDGKWMYLNASAGGSFHIWRQRAPDGQPQQMTQGPTEEEGIAVPADGRSLITAVGLRQRSVLVRDSRGERQISLEGYALLPLFTPDGKRLCYLILKGSSANSDPIELWSTDLERGQSDRYYPAFRCSVDARLISHRTAGR